VLAEQGIDAVKDRAANPTQRGVTPEKVSIWTEEGARDYAPVKHGLPVKEESITQIAPGELLTDSSLITTGDVALFKVQVGVRSVGVTVLNPDYVSFAIPTCWNGEYIVNGEAAKSTRIYMPGSSDSFYIRGDRRETLGVILERDQFIETIAALRGVGPEEINLNDRSLELSPIAAVNLRAQFLAILDIYTKEEQDITLISQRREFAYKVFGLITDAYLSAHTKADSTTGRRQPATQIVRKAEECFIESEMGSVSLADLCMAAGVSKSTLYNAFHNTCGEPPLEYFHKRRLMKARTILINSPPERGAIKRAALDVGLTELGRFSVEYRRLFGESPSVTINKSFG